MVHTHRIQTGNAEALRLVSSGRCWPRLVAVLAFFLLAASAAQAWAVIINEYDIPTFSSPMGITSGPDGNVWFAALGGGIGKITTAGVITEYAEGGGFALLSGMLLALTGRGRRYPGGCSRTARSAATRSKAWSHHHGRRGVMRLVSTIVFAALICALLAQPVQACSTAQLLAYNQQGTGAKFGQSFTAECSGYLYRFAVELTGAGSTHTLKVYSGETDVTPIYTQAGVDLNSTGTIWVQLTTPVAVTNGQLYTFILEATGGNATFTANDTNPYAAGRMYFSGTFSATGFDITFQVSISDYATVTTAAMSNVTTTTATSGGQVTSNGGSPVKNNGVCWNTTGSPTTADSLTNDPLQGAYTSSLTGLSAGTTYYVRAWALNDIGASYGNQVSFTTSAAPSASIDILWRNNQNGKNTVWLMNGTTFSSNVALPDVATAWTIGAVGDLDNDGKSDILWRNTRDGRNVVWYMNGTTRRENASLETIANQAWSMVGAGDFNNDGKTDILWRNLSNTRTVAWLMSNATRLSTAWANNVVSPWVIEGVGDIDNDGYVDILWRNHSNNKFIIWLMGGTIGDLVLKQAVQMQDVPSAWYICGVGDFNGDGKKGILWRNKQNGRNVVWLMNGTTSTISLEIRTVAPSTGWDISGVGVFH